MKRYVKSNSKYSENYDPTHPEKYLFFVDYVGFYYAMMLNTLLPNGGYEFLSKDEIVNRKDNLMNYHKHIDFSSEVKWGGG